MKVEKPELTVHINLPQNFVEKIKEVMEDEIDVASKKWKVKLTEDERQTVIKHSLNQVQRKVSENIRTSWDLGDTLHVKVFYSRGGELTLPDPSLSGLKSRLVRPREGWRIEEDEPNDDMLHILDMDSFFVSSIYTWSRTAVFYGVSSYAS